VRSFALTAGEGSAIAVSDFFSGRFIAIIRSRRA
jgi:hypothetical protein